MEILSVLLNLLLLYANFLSRYVKYINFFPYIVILFFNVVRMGELHKFNSYEFRF